jgi:hypothetical protein
MVFEPLSGSFEFKRIPVIGAGGLGGSVTNGTLILPGGVELELAGGVAIVNGSEITLEPGAQLLVLP